MIESDPARDASNAEALQELSHIDFLLDELARAVERGEVHRASYDLMAPRYLERRADLVAYITGVPRAVAPAPGPGGSGVPGIGQTGPQAFDEYFASGVPAARPARATMPSRPVDWTTVLLFLGAFLVIVAAAIFSVAVWRDLGTGAKLAFLGTLTAGFYGAGWWARVKLRLPVGAVALTAVASAMLLFDGWIMIDGYRLEGPAPWAAVLLVCSAMYWYTETLLSSRFFGVVGAAAQVAWWWLLGAGLGLPATVRIAGIALVAVAWQLAAERGRGRPAVGSLSTVLEWAAPVVAAGASLAILSDLGFVGGSSVDAVIAAALTAVSAAIVMRRTHLLPESAQGIGGALAQLPLIASAWVATGDAGGSWWVLVVFVIVAIACDLLAFAGWGVAFLVVGLLAEASAVLELCRVLDAGESTTVVALAGLAALWAFGATLVPRLGGDTIPPERSGRLAFVLEIAAWTLLGAASLALPLAGWMLPVPGFPLVRGDVLGYVGVLAAWWAATIARPRGAAAYAGVLWAFVTASALVAWLAPDSTLSGWASWMVALGGVWLASADATRRYGDSWPHIARWSAWALLAALLGLGLLSGLVPMPVSSTGVLGLDPRWDAAVLAAAVAAVLAADALRSRCRPSALVAGIAVPVAALRATEAASGLAPYAPALIVSLAALACAFASVLLARRGPAFRALVAWFAAGAAVTATVLVAGEVPRFGLAAALAWIVLAVTWAASAVVTAQWVAIAAGVALVPAAWSALGAAPEPVAAIGLLGVVGFALTAVGRLEPFGPDGRLADAGRALAVAGIIAHASLVLDGGLDSHALTVALLVLSSNLAVTSALHRFEPGFHLAGLPLVAAAWVEIGLLAGPPAVLYSTPLALYLVAAGHVHVGYGRATDRPRAYPEVLDVFAVLVGLGYPLMSALGAGGDRALGEALAVVVVALLAIGAGIALKVRWYFFGGVFALAAIAFYRSFSAIAEYWWLVLGIIGVALLAIALTWERQRMVVADTRERLRRSFEGWR